MEPTSLWFHDVCGTFKNNFPLKSLQRKLKCIIISNIFYMWCNLVVLFHFPGKVPIGDRKDCICLRLRGQKSSSPYTAISALLDSEGRAFVLIQVLYCLKVMDWLTKTVCHISVRMWNCHIQITGSKKEFYQELSMRKRVTHLSLLKAILFQCSFTLLPPSYFALLDHSKWDIVKLFFNY